MIDQIKITSALISVYSKDGIEEIAKILESHNVRIYSTGGTYDFLLGKGIAATSIEAVTSYPSILGGRVKTLHPKVFGGILWRRDSLSDVKDVEHYDIPSVDLVIVDLYPFEKTVAGTDNEEEIIEKIDIGGISLIRAAAKNYRHVVVIPSADHYKTLMKLLEENNGFSNAEERRYLAAQAFNVSSHYDTQIFNYFNRKEKIAAFKQSHIISTPMRYGENPHQKGSFYGSLQENFEQIHGKALSYNNLVDIDAAINLIAEFREPAVAVIKHTNPCGVACRDSIKDAYLDALACDGLSAYGGIVIANRKIDMETAGELNKLFFEILLAPEYEKNALEVLKSKKNRIILRSNPLSFSSSQFKSVLNGVLEQDKDLQAETETDFQFVTKKRPSVAETSELLFANKIVKHLKSNTIVISKNKQLIGCGMGQTSRVDAMKQAILKAATFGFDTNGAVMASDAFFPFADSVEIAHEAGISAVIQPGGSIRDADSVKFCDDHDMAMVFTGIRHFKH
ncbi:MAG: bifunctional phosphoribosylaminoimidazolecarboxamide formyltransferase/IMP cyclohydrolase [Bacteroidota bacterium]